MIDPVLWDAARFFLAALFALALWHKLIAVREFVGIVKNYRVLPEWLATPGAATVILSEVAVLLALVSGTYAPLAGFAAVALLATYMGVIGINLARGRTEIDCGCMGPVGPKARISHWLLLRNAALIGVALLVGLTGPAIRELAWFDYVTIVGAVGTGFIIYFGAEELIRNAPFIAEIRP